MGRVKQRALELEDKGLTGTKDTFVCAAHINDYAIKDFIKGSSEPGQCSYCGRRKRVIAFEELMYFIMEGITSFYQDAAEFMSYESSEGGYQGDTYTPDELINDVIGLEIDDYPLQLDIIDCIDDRAWSDPNSYFDSEKDILVYHWNWFKDVVKHKSRYLFAKTEKFTLETYHLNAYDILDEIGTKISAFGLIKTIPAGTDFYRCRQHENATVICDALQIGSPPKKFAIYPNRMSPAGISMFYGAFDKETAKAETVDAKMVSNPKLTTAVFKNRNKLTLIDLTSLPKMPSMFDSGNLKNYYSIGFLNDFVKDLSKGIVHDKKEHIEYVPTQIVTEYFRYVYNPGTGKTIDGIIYPSSKKIGGNACVLFMDSEESLGQLDFSKSGLFTEDI